MTNLSAPVFRNYPSLFEEIDRSFKTASVVHSKNWQGVDISTKNEMAMHELRDVSFKVPYDNPIPHVPPPERWAEQVIPNLPWCDNHFAERVSGQPMNPGTEWANWPWGNNASKFLEPNGQFNHNYMERYWPKFAGGVTVPTGTAEDYSAAIQELPLTIYNKGIRYRYGDLNDVVSLLVKDPNTRQAYLPIFFPEDTGGMNGRVPCTLGYLFMMREGKLHITYYIRSCDYVRHMRDDVYLTLLLQLWVLNECRKRNRQWNAVEIGDFQMSIGSLHMFRNDYVQRYGVTND